MGAASLILYPFPQQPPLFSSNYRSVPSLRIPIRNPKLLRFKLLAQNPNPNPNNGGGDSQEDTKKEKRRPAAQVNIRWRDLLDPDPENIVAVGLTGLLTWAIIQVLWQLLFISGAIVLAALKYSFIAALLLFVLITLL